jgi:formylmethanofuran dehydrogenase subunit D
VYTAQLKDWSTYNFSNYVGVIWLPTGYYHNIQIGDKTYSCTVTNSFKVGANVIS